MVFAALTLIFKLLVNIFSPFSSNSAGQISKFQTFFALKIIFIKILFFEI
jgi:hypothetical protein